MKTLTAAFLIVFCGLIKAQYPFEKYPALKFHEYKNWIKSGKVENGIYHHSSLTIPKFYKNGDSMVIGLASCEENADSSFIIIHRNKKPVENVYEPMNLFPFDEAEPILVADINGDGLSDMKFTVSYMGCGLAAMNVRVIYLFQNPDGSFKKVSFVNMMSENDRPERDFNGDKNYEILTMSLTGYKNHSYWLYDLYNYTSGGLVNVNSKFDYPIMIQYLYRANYEITKNISREKMKEFAMPLPEDYDVR
jgi:hypothetical protein